MSIPDIQNLRAELAESERDPVRTIAAVHGFLQGVGLSTQELRPLLVLWGALEDHARGKPHPLLAVRSRGGNRSHAADDMFKACAVAAVALLMRTGKTRAKATEQVSKSLKVSDIAVDAATLRTWHKEITTGRHADEGVVNSYRVLLRRFLAEEGREQAAESLLASLPEMMREKV